MCYALKYWLQKAGASTTLWGFGHSNFDTPFSELESKNDIIISLENYDTGWHPDISRSSKYKVFWSIDSHCVLQNHIAFCHANKINLHLNSTENYLKHYNFCDNAVWFPNAVDTRYFGDKNIERDIPLGFCGSIIADRQHWIKFIESYFNLRVDANVLGDKMIETISRYQIALNKTIADDHNSRIFESLACKTPLITNYQPNLEKLFDLDSDFLVYQSAKELVGVISILQKDGNLLKTIAENGYNKVMNKHTFEKRCEYLYKILSEI